MANSVANFSYNLFGYLPAPIMYGYFYELGDSKHNHFGLLSIQIFTIVAFACMTLTYYRNGILKRKYMHLDDFSVIGLDGEINLDDDTKVFVAMKPNP